jgi:hypothetical protein
MVLGVCEKKRSPLGANYTTALLKDWNGNVPSRGDLPESAERMLEDGQLH